MAVMYTFDVTRFRTMFPEYSDVILYPDLTLQGYWDLATCYIFPFDECWLAGCKRENALYFMTAHLTAMGDNILSKLSPGIRISTTIDKISVAIKPPPFANQWQYWLGQTARGQELMAFLSLVTVGGFTVGGVPQSPTFRNSWGGFC
jgi:hypothetical protein